jgi:hypothetical protein
MGTRQNVAMSVRIVQDVPAGRLPWQRLSRLILALVGLVLVVAGFLAAVLPIMLVAAVIYSVVRGESLEMTGGDLVGFGALGAGAAVVMWLGVMLIRGRRRLGLYLRKFGFADTTRTVSQALKSAVGRSVRLVTLDDSQVAPVGVGAGRRIVALLWILAAVLAAWLSYYLFGGGFTADSDKIINDAVEQASNNAGDGLADQLGAAFGGALAGGIVAGFFLVLLLAALIIVLLVGVFAYRAHRSARRAQREASQALAQRQQVGTVARRLDAVARKVFSPRLMVVAVPGSFWREAIHGFAAVSKVAVIDVSHPTDPLLWEVATLKPLFGSRLVFVGARDLVGALARPPHEIAGTPHGALAQLLDGEEIIAYGPTGPDRHRFTTALRRRIANLPPARQAA